MKNFNTIKELAKFVVGSKVAIIDSITGKISYEGVIVALAKHAEFNKRYNRFERPAVIKINGGVRCNCLGTALLIK